MKAAWQSRQLGDVAEVIAGQSPHGSFYNESGVGLPFYQGKKDFSDRYINAPTTWTTQVTKVARDGDVLMSVRAPVGPVNFATEDCCIGRGLAAIRSQDGLDRNFLFYFLLSKEDEICGNAGAIFSSINRSDIQCIPIAVPDVSEQQRIVSVLDEAFEAIATTRTNAEKNLRNVRALFESHLHAEFEQSRAGWVKMRLEQLGTTQTGSTPKTSDKRNFGGFIPFVKPADFKKDGSLDYDNDGLSESGLLTARRVRADSVLMVCIGTIGKCAYTDRDITTNQQINSLTVQTGYDPRFIYYQMLTRDFQNRVRRSSSQTTIPIINKSKWSALTLCVPPTQEEQALIAGRLDALATETQRLESIYQRKLAALDELKKSLLHRAFAGEL